MIGLLLALVVIPKMKKQSAVVLPSADSVQVKVEEEVKKISDKVESAAVKFCPNCGTKLLSGVKFCPSCGTKVA